MKVVYMAIPMAIGSILVFYNCCDDTPKARTMTLICMAMFQWYNAWNCRSETESIFKLGLFSNFWLVVATIFVLILQILVCHVGFLQIIFKTVPINFNEWLLIFLVSSTLLIIEELRKYFAKKFLPD